MYVFPATYVVVRINFFRIQEHEPYSPSKMLKFRKDEFDILTPNGIMNGSELLAGTQPQYWTTSTLCIQELFKRLISHFEHLRPWLVLKSATSLPGVHCPSDSTWRSCTHALMLNSTTILAISWSNPWVRVLYMFRIVAWPLIEIAYVRRASILLPP